MSTKYIFLSSLVAVALVGAGCSNSANVSSSVNTNARVSEQGQQNGVVEPNNPERPGENGNVEVNTNANSNINTSANEWPATGSWSSMKVTSSSGSASDMTRLAVAFSAGGREYEGVEISGSSSRGLSGSTIMFWQKGDRFGASTKSAASVNVPGVGARVLCQNVVAASLDQIRLLDSQYYGSLDSQGSESIRLSGGKTVTATKYAISAGGQSSTSWINPQVPFLVVKSQTSSGIKTELVDYGTSGKVAVFTGAQLSTCGL